MDRPGVLQACLDCLMISGVTDAGFYLLDGAVLSLFICLRTRS